MFNFEDADILYNEDKKLYFEQLTEILIWWNDNKNDEFVWDVVEYLRPWVYSKGLRLFNRLCFHHRGHFEDAVNFTCLQLVDVLFRFDYTKHIEDEYEDELLSIQKVSTSYLSITIRGLLLRYLRDYDVLPRQDIETPKPTIQSYDKLLEDQEQGRNVGVLGATKSDVSDYLVNKEKLEFIIRELKRLLSEEFNSYEEAKIVYDYLTLGNITQLDVGKKLGVSQMTVSRKISKIREELKKIEKEYLK